MSDDARARPTDARINDSRTGARNPDVTFALPAMLSAAAAAQAAGAVLSAVAGGELTPSEGAHVMALVEA